MPRTIIIAQEIAYLRTIADTGNASLAAARAGVSRDWAYKKRKADAGFDSACREALALFRETPPLPTLSREGRGVKRTRVNRDRAGGWTADKEARFVERMHETCSAWLAAAEVGLSAASAYRRRQARPAFAAAWDEAEASGWPPGDEPWIESAIAFLEGEPPPPGNPVRVTRVGEALDALQGNRFVARRPRMRRG